jgi:hypothetical protein
MSHDKLGRVRRSAVVMTHGPGAIIDFRSSSGAPVSVVAAGLDHWDELAKPAGLMNPQRVHEQRLEAKLGVSGFRLPPATEEPPPGIEPDPSRPLLPAVRFPEWLTCPTCNLIQPLRRWKEQPGDPAPYCRRCSDEQGGRVYVVPVRFVLACARGHLDEFPWTRWIEHASSCNQSRPLKLEGMGAGLKGLVLSCTGCGKRRSMDGAFSPHTLRELEVHCEGRRPWLPGRPEWGCRERPVVVQRGASNTYFPAMESALSIPPWLDDLETAIGEFWAHVTSAATPQDRDEVVRLVIKPVWEGPETVEELQAMVRQRVEQLEAGAQDNLRLEEYRYLTAGADISDKASELSLRVEPLPAGLSGFLHHAVQVTRLREVRALYGFSRVHPPSGGFGSGSVADISVAKKRWLPAVEVRGEGIFLTLDETRLAAWEVRPKVVARAAALDQKHRADLKARIGDDAKPEYPITPRFVLIHTLAHALMGELSLECGYSTSSLRERLYVDGGQPGMCGVLIYTAAPDADGTLGGLVRQGRGDRLEPLLRAAVEGTRWCASDPLCMSGVASLSDGLNGAACHACAMAPETSCETFNRFLDRALLIGLPGDTALPPDQRTGYFDGFAGMDA